MHHFYLQRYGKLTQSDLEALFLLLPQLKKERVELQALVDQKPAKFAEKFLSTGFAWAHLYEVPFLQLVSDFLVVTGLDEAVVHAAAQEEPVQAIHDHLETTDNLAWTGGSGGKFTPGDLLGYLHAVVGNLECLLIYGSYLNDFIAEAKNGDLGALLKAIRIDPSVVSGPTARNLISVAIVMGEKGLCVEIGKAMAGKTGRQASYLKKFRLLMQTLHEVGSLGLPTREIMELVFKLGAYERKPGAEKNVSELILKAKALKKNTISKWKMRWSLAPDLI